MSPEVRKLLFYGGLIAAAVYLVKSGFSALQTAVFTPTGEWIGGTLYDFLNPGAAGELLYFNTLFPDNARHAVPSQSLYSSAASESTFTLPQFYGDQQFIMKTDAAGNHVAVAA